MMDESANQLPNLIKQAMATLDKATTAAEVLEARDNAAFVYDEARAAERLAKAKHAHDTVIAACRQAQADALEHRDASAMQTGRRVRRRAGARPGPPKPATASGSFE